MRGNGHGLRLRDQHDTRDPSCGGDRRRRIFRDSASSSRCSRFAYRRMVGLARRGGAISFDGYTYPQADALYVKFPHHIGSTATSCPREQAPSSNRLARRIARGVRCGAPTRGSLRRGAGDDLREAYWIPMFRARECLRRRLQGEGAVLQSNADLNLTGVCLEV